MKARLSKYWRSLKPQQRIVFTVLAAILVVSSYAWLFDSATRARTQLRANISAIKPQIAALERRAAEYQRLRDLPVIAPSRTELRTLVQAQTNAAGLSNAQARIESSDENHVQVIFGAVPFADWMVWLDNLQSQQIRLESCRIEALSATGMVSVTSTLVRSRLQ